MSTTKTALIILSLACILCNTKITATAQSLRGNGQPPIKNIITINPFILFSGSMVDVKYERTFNDLFSLVINPTLYNPSVDNTVRYSSNSSTNSSYSSNYMDNFKYQSLNIWFQGRFYLSNKYDAPRGWFVAPEISFGYVSISGDDITSTYNNQTFQDDKVTKSLKVNSATVNTGLVVGYQTILKGHFAIDAYLGITRYNISDKATSDLFTKLYNTQILPSWGLGFGYAF